MTAFSFQAIKTLTTGDGGALTVPDEWLSRAKDMRWFGISREAEVDFRGELDITEWGFKAHMNDIAASIGLANLDVASVNLGAQVANRIIYDAALSVLFGRTHKPSYGDGAWWLYTTLLPDAKERDRFVGYMKQRGVAVSRVHWRNDRLTIFKPYQKVLPGVDSFSDRMVCLPTHTGVNALEVAGHANSFFDA
jgi:dTDP-4-amino-4,6-dideoxygalactose transaminase